MATVNYIPESNQSISAMKAVIDYCLQQKKVADEDSGRRLVSGVNCNGENSFTEFMATKNANKKKGGITFYHYVQSFSPRENVSAEQVHKISLAFAEKAWPGHEVLVTTHIDAEHLHTVALMQNTVEQAGKNQEKFILNCSETLSKSTKALDGLIEKLQQKIMKIMIATAVSAVVLSVLVCVMFWKLAV
ncbi:relaxase/mobilization nuclease domain-containing protein [Acutalibacter muris]|uniref:relaxase/mobilization nuclease domain-containing protein n=1 Tax=Acutalibacter muris TaxID=1796620 RepID=UPI0020CD18B1|nr:relaxase/mobilization nuclease domain-containing protein [Acutalibacter muris]